MRAFFWGGSRAPVGAGLLAMVVNDNAAFLNARVVWALVRSSDLLI